MASIQRVDGKAGPSFRIFVTKGKDLNGKQVRHTMTWKPETKMTERQMQKAAEKIAADFEQQIETGFQVDNKQTFSEYARYAIDVKERGGCKHRTVYGYRQLLPRCDQAIGHLKLVDIRPHHLNAFYKNLAEDGIRQSSGKATASEDLTAIIKAHGLTKAATAEKANVCRNTLLTACKGGKIAGDKAEAIAKALNMKCSELFTLERDTAPLSPKTQLSYHTFIHMVLDMAEREMIVSFNAASRAVPPKVPHGDADHLQIDEIQDVLEALEDEPIKWQMLINLLMVTGCRRSEIVGLKWSKIDFEKHTVKIDTALLYTPDRGIFEGPTKTSDMRLLSLPAETMALLRKYRAWYSELRLANGDRWQDSGFVFVQDDGRPMQPDSVGSWLTRFSKRHGLPPLHAHIFRHTAASVLIHSGVDVVSVSKRLGHSRTSTTTDIYAHIMQEADQQATEALADALFRRKRA